jgi:outer membrane lipoprotein SlyB
VILFFRIIPLLLSGVLLTACVKDGVGKYRVQSVGNAQRSIAAIVLSTSPVIIAKDTSGAGANAGGALGGSMAIDNSDSATVLVAGIIAGAVIGNAIEANGNTYDGTEYVIETEARLLLTVAQVNGNEKIFKKGDRVVLVYGYPHRLIRDPR